MAILKRNALISTSLLEHLKKSRVLKYFKFLILVIICAYLYSIVEWQELINLLKKISVGFFVLTFFICMLDQVFMALKWQILLRMFKIRVPVIDSIAAYLGGRAVNLVIPSGVGVDAYKTYYLKKKGIATTSTISSIIVERFIGIFSSLAIVCLLLYFPFRTLNVPNRLVLSLAGIFLFIIIAVFIFIFVKYSNWFSRACFPGFIPIKITAKLREISLLLSEIKKNRNSVLIYYFASIIEKLFYGTAIFTAARAVGIESVDFTYIIAATPFLALMERMPISFAAIGVREGLLVGLFLPYFNDPTIPISVALVLRAAEIILIILSLSLLIREGVKKESLKPTTGFKEKEIYRPESAESYGIHH